MFAMLLPMLVAAGVVEAESICPTYSFQPSARFDVGAIKRLARDGLANENMTTTGGAELVLLPFDVEDPPISGQWEALAVVYVTRGDLAEQTIGGLLRQSLPAPAIDIAAARVTKDSDAVQVTLPAGHPCPSYIIRLENDGTLIVQGRIIGRLR